MATKDPQPGDSVVVHHQSPHVKKHKKHKIVSVHYGPYYGLRHLHGGVTYMPSHHTDPAPDPNAPPNAEPGPGQSGTGPHASDSDVDFLDYIVDLINRKVKKYHNL